MSVTYALKLAFVAPAAACIIAASAAVASVDYVHRRAEKLKRQSAARRQLRAAREAGAVGVVLARDGRTLYLTPAERQQLDDALDRSERAS